MFPSASAIANAVVPVDRHPRGDAPLITTSHTGDHSAKPGRGDSVGVSIGDRTPGVWTENPGRESRGGAAAHPAVGTSARVARALSKHVHRSRAASLLIAGSRFTGHSAGSATRAPRGASFHASM